MEYDSNENVIKLNHITGELAGIYLLIINLSDNIETTQYSLSIFIDLYPPVVV